MLQTAKLYLYLSRQAFWCFLSSLRGSHSPSLSPLLKVSPPTFHESDWAHISILAASVTR